MPVYLFTYHAYRSWRPDDPRGFVQEGEGIQPPSEPLANAYDNAAKHPPVTFDHVIQQFLIETAHDVCNRRGWRLHGAATEPTHLHTLVSWRDETAWSAVRGKIKNILSTAMSKRAGLKGRPWFVDKASRRHVRDQKHFDYLMHRYLPKHSGVGWYEDGRGWQPPHQPPASAGG